MIHNLKILPCFFHSVKENGKLFEIRDNSDRNFQKGDTVYLTEWKDCKYTGKMITVLINYVTSFEQKPNFVVFGFSILKASK